MNNKDKNVDVALQSKYSIEGIVVFFLDSVTRSLLIGKAFPRVVCRFFFWEIARIFLLFSIIFLEVTFILGYIRSKALYFWRYTFSRENNFLFNNRGEGILFSWIFYPQILLSKWTCVNICITSFSLSIDFLPNNYSLIPNLPLLSSVFSLNPTFLIKS